MAGALAREGFEGRAMQQLGGRRGWSGWNGQRAHVYDATAGAERGWGAQQEGDWGAIGWQEAVRRGAQLQCECAWSVERAASSSGACKARRRAGFGVCFQSTLSDPHAWIPAVTRLGQGLTAATGAAIRSPAPISPPPPRQRRPPPSSFTSAALLFRWPAQPSDLANSNFGASVP